MTQFVRFAGCNLKCPGWPCDTPYSIDPKLYRAEQQTVSAEKLANDILDVANHTGAANICFTGGEPLIQPQGELVEVIARIRRKEKSWIDYFEIFTNGTQAINPRLAELAAFVVDWKLPGSGEVPVGFGIRLNNLKVLETTSDSVKFVIAEQRDLESALDYWSEFLSDSIMQIFVGPAWGKFEAERIVDFVKEHKLPWRLNIQVHNYIYGGPTRRGI